MGQKSLFSQKYPLVYGGELAKRRKKSRRPLARQRPIHFVLKSKRNLYAKKVLIEGEIRRFGAKFAIRLYSIAVAADHVHFVARIPGRREYTGFIRALTGLLARRLGRGLWPLLPFSRVASWGRDFSRLQRYLEQNREEAAGARPDAPRRNWYARHLALSD